MKPDTKIQNKSTGCAAGHCLNCSVCSEVNYEEIRGTKPEIKHAVAELYAAEAQNYYFYFTSHDRSLR